MLCVTPRASRLKAYVTIPRLTTVEEIAALLEETDLNKFELAGVALTQIYTWRPELIESRHLQRLAHRNFYPECEILGDLALNLALQGYDPLKVITDQRFWAPIWEVLEIAFAEIHAAAARTSIRNWMTRGAKETSRPTSVKRDKPLR